MSVHVHGGDTVVVIDGPELDVLRKVLESYISGINAKLSVDLWRDLQPDERFNPTPEMKELIMAFRVDPSLWCA